MPNAGLQYKTVMLPVQPCGPQPNYTHSYWYVKRLWGSSMTSAGQKNLIHC